MPYRVQSQSCTKADGSEGSAVVEKQKQDGTWTVVACTDDKQDARAIKARIEKSKS